MSYPRELTVKPRRRGYRHRPIIVVTDGIGVTETGELVRNLPLFASSNESHLWVCIDPAALLATMRQAFDHLACFQYQLTSTHEDVPEGVPYLVTTRLVRFGFTNGRNNRPPKGIRREGQHIVWTPQDMMRNPMTVLDGNRHGDLMRFATDVRDWCKEQDIPLPTSLAGIGASLLRDARFWPHARGRVPRATNERVRKYLPGVHTELRAATNRRTNAVTIDQRRAYHRAAQAVPMPDPSTLFARGYFMDAENAPRPWAWPGSPLYEKTVKQPGIVCAQVSSRLTHKNETRPPAIDFIGTRRIFLWTNELAECQRLGAFVHYLTAAWTSTRIDPGFALYGEWAESQVDSSSDYRRRWLKPTLHSTYGLLGARDRQLRLGFRHGNGDPATYILGHGHEVPVRETRVKHTPATVSTAGLGVLQSEIRLRSMTRANALMAEGVEVLHIHADGMHVRGAVPLLAEDEDWSMDTLTRLIYLDPVSWMADERACLPGRDARTRADTIRHHARGAVRDGAILAPASKPTS